MKSHLDIPFLGQLTQLITVLGDLCGVVCFCFSSLLVSLVPLFLSFCLFYLFSQIIQPCMEWPQAHSLNFIFFFLIYTYFLSDLIQSLDFQYHRSCMMSSYDAKCQISVTSSPFYLSSKLRLSATSQTSRHRPNTVLPHTMTSYLKQSLVCSFPFSAY